MEIDKIAFENLRTLGITKSFDDLDVNNDGKITKDDLSLAQDGKISSQIMQMLELADDDAELILDDEPAMQKSGAAKNEYGFYQTDSDTFEQDVTNTKGTVYLVMGNLPGCGHCMRLENKLQEMKDEVEANANIVNIQWRSSVKNNNQLCWDIIKQVETDNKKFMGGFPVVVKFVDGKPVEMISQGGKGDFTPVIEDMIKKAEGTKGTINGGNTVPTTTAGATTTSTKTQADITKAVNDLLSKYPVEGTSGSGYSLKNHEVAALKKAVEGGIISELAKEGFSQSDIINIIAQAYPKAGIKNNDKGGFTVPRGSGADAKEFYNMFIEEMNKATSAEVLALQAEVKALNDQILANNAKLDVLKVTIETLKRELEALIEKAIEESEEIEEEQKAEAKKIVAEELDKYSSANGEMTYEEFESALSDKLNSLAGESNSKLSNVVSKMMKAESKMSVLSGYLNTFGSLVTANKSLSEKAVIKTDEVQKVQEECAKSCENVQRCDPIGFSANGVKYDFFVDKDGNGEITNETEFLGATGGWDEMVALDNDGDGNVSVSEMSNIKVVVTAQDGSQTVKSVADLFSQTDSVDLSSYKAMNKDFANGNTLLGTFSLTFNGEKVNDAYNTMDKLSWLDENYNFSDKENGTGRFAQGNTKYETAKNYEKELTVFKLDYEKMEVKLGSAWSKLGITRADLIYQLGIATEKEAEAKASSIKDKIEQKVEEEENKKKPVDEDCPDCSVNFEE